MAKSIIVEGKTSTEAIEKGLKELKASRNQVEVKIIEEKKKSFFNILDPHVVKVELILKEETVKVPNRERKTEKKEIKKEDINISKHSIEVFLDEFLKKISEKITYTIEINEDIIHVTINGENSTKLIGYRGESLNSLQVILSTIANKGQESNIKVILDIGNYKEVREKTLKELAEKVARNVKKTGKSITLEPMTAYERKIIHSKLRVNTRAETHSIGEGDKRRIVISEIK